MIQQPRLIVDSDGALPGCRWIDVQGLDSDLLAELGKPGRTDERLKLILRVRVADIGSPVDEELPDVLGHVQVQEGRLRFIPRFPLEPGVRYRACFDPRLLGRSDLCDVLILDFSLPDQASVGPTEVDHVFPSPDSLPENLLRFYVSFSNSMQRGQAEEQIRVLGPEGCVAPDVLYRPPVELWDKSMRHLTVLLDPGRLKRRVGPHRDLGPPLRPGQEYTLAIGAGMVDRSGRPLRESYYKSFRVTAAIREAIAPERWRIHAPPRGSHDPLRLLFPRPLDWALLWQAITIVSCEGQPIQGRVAIDDDERRWSFIPQSPWERTEYRVRIAPDLADVCGNDLLAPFDGPLRLRGSSWLGRAHRSIPFHVAA